MSMPVPNTSSADSSVDSSLGEILSATVNIARGAGAILREGLAAISANGGTHMKFKTSDIDPVTEYDVRSEKYIVGELHKLFPSHRIVGEEGGAYQAASPDAAADGHHYVWQIDPLDGTVNFAHGFFLF